MRAKDIMHTRVLTAKPDGTVQDIVKMMLDFNVSMIPVVDDRKNIIGVVTEGDIIYRAYADVKTPDIGVALLGKLRAMLKTLSKQTGGTAREIMTETLYTVSEEAPLAEIAKIMVEKKVKNVPVTQEGHLVGLVTRRDIVRLVLEGQI